VLLTSLGGTTYAWGSAPIYILGVLGAVFTVAFVAVERRAAEPVLPLHLFSVRAFWSTSVVGFIVGFAMFGAITYLPYFFQIVKGASPTRSGVDLLPLMAGLLVVSIASGQIISRTGRYRLFPIAGTAVLTLGVYLLSRLGLTTGTALASLYMIVLGMGLGGVMQVLVLIVQNAVPYSELGVATSAATFFRSIGGSFGTAIFGAIFSNVLVTNLAAKLHGVKVPAGINISSLTPAILHRLPSALRDGIISATAETIRTVFLVAVPIALLAFAFSWMIPHLELRRTNAAPAPDDTTTGVADEAPTVGAASAHH